MGTCDGKGDEMTQELDFIWKLNDYINTLDLFAHSNVGLLEGESISVLAMPGGNETVFHDGVRDKDYQVQINAKSKNQLNCVESLSKIAKKLELLEDGDIQSGNDTFDFQNINVTSFVSIVGQDEQGYFIYQVSISAKITIYGGN